MSQGIDKGFSIMRRRDDSASSGDRAPAGSHGPAIGKRTRVESLSDPSVQGFVQSSEPASSGRSETPQRESAARWTPSVAIGQAAPMRAPATAKAAAATPPAADPGPQSAAVYFADNQARFFAAIRTRLAAAGLPPPHERLVWGTDGLVHGIAFERAMVGAYGTDMDLALALPTLLSPVDPFEVIDLHRDLSSGRPGERTDRQPALGPLTWNPIVGQALALEIEASLRRSLPRMGLRYVAQADDYRGQLAPDQLVTSHPFDRVVARLLCDPTVARYVPAHGKPGRRADTASPAAFRDGLRLVMFEWQGARDPKLWNWVRVTEPADARPEEVAASVFERGDGQSHTEHAYALTAAPPYFRIPPAWARKLPAAAEHAPRAEAGEEAQSRSALDLADSPLGDDAARAQAGKPVAKLDIAGLAHTLDRSELQLQLASERLADWKIGYLVGPAQRWIRRHKDVVRAAPDATLKQWAAIAAAQSATLTEAMGDLLEITDLARSARVAPGAPEARPFRDVIEALGIAMGESHLAQTATAQLAAARRQKGMLPLTLLDRTMRENHDAAQELAATAQVPISEADHTDPRQVAAGTNRTLEAGTLALRQKALATGSIDAAELEAVTVAASEETLRTRILTLYGKLNQLLDASDQATEGFFGHVGNARNADIWNLRTELVTIRPLAWNILDTMRKEAIPPPPIPPDPELARVAFARARKQAVANAQRSFARLAEDRQLQTLFSRALATLSDAQKNTAYFKLACEIAALIGVSIAGSVAGAMVGGLVRGAMLADAATDAAMFARTATAARWAGTAANVATDAAMQSAMQTSVFGGNTKLTFIENVMANLMTLGALRPFHALTGELGKLDKNATGLWKLASGGKVALAETGKLTIETLVAAGATYVSARLVEGQPPPSEDAAVSWAMQGASMAVGKFVHGRMQELTARWGKLAEEKVQLIKRARAQEALARQVEQSGSTEAALRLLEQHVRLLHDEHTLLQDPAAAARLGLDDTQLGVLRAGNDAALADTHSQSFEIMRLRFHGLEPLAGNGLAWSGTRSQIEAALGESGSAVAQVQRAEDGRWTANIAGREVTFIEHAPQTKASGRIDEPVPGLFDGVDPHAQIADWELHDVFSTEPDGTKVIETHINLPDSSEGYMERAYNPATKKLELRNAFCDQLPRWVNESKPALIKDKGVPTVTYLTIRQMKLLGVDYGGLNKIKMSTIQNVRAVVEFNVLLMEGVDPDVAVMRTHSVDYAKTALVQSGHQITVGHVVLRGPSWNTALDVMLQHYETGGQPGSPRDPDVVAKHDQIIAQYGQGKITRDTHVDWNYDIELTVTPYSGGKP